MNITVWIPDEPVTPDPVKGRGLADSAGLPAGGGAPPVVVPGDTALLGKDPENAAEIEKLKGLIDGIGKVGDHLGKFLKLLDTTLDEINRKYSAADAAEILATHGEEIAELCFQLAALELATKAAKEKLDAAIGTKNEDAATAEHADATTAEAYIALRIRMLGGVATDKEVLDTVGTGMKADLLRMERRFGGKVNWKAGDIEEIWDDSDDSDNVNPQDHAVWMPIFANDELLRDRLEDIYDLKWPNDQRWLAVRIDSELTYQGLHNKAYDFVSKYSTTQIALMVTSAVLVTWLTGGAATALAAKLGGSTAATIFALGVAEAGGAVAQNLMTKAITGEKVSASEIGTDFLIGFVAGGLGGAFAKYLTPPGAGDTVAKYGVEGLKSPAKSALKQWAKGQVSAVLHLKEAAIRAFTKESEVVWQLTADRVKNLSKKEAEFLLAKMAAIEDRFFTGSVRKAAKSEIADARKGLQNLRQKILDQLDNSADKRKRELARELQETEQRVLRSGKKGQAHAAWELDHMDEAVLGGAGDIDNLWMIPREVNQVLGGTRAKDVANAIEALFGLGGSGRVRVKFVLTDSAETVIDTAGWSSLYSQYVRATRATVMAEALESSADLYFGK